jgi:hypothetical protein
MKKRLTISLVSLISSFAAALDIEPFLGWDVTRDPAVGISEYDYTDGTTEKLVAGDGFGLLIGTELFQLDKVSFDARIGAQFKSMDATDVDGYDTSDVYYFFPVFLNANYEISKRWSVSGGASILLKPTYWQQYDGEDYFVTAKHSIGFNAELRYLAIPASLESKMETYYVFRYLHNNIEYDEIDDGDDTYDFDEYNDAYGLGLTGTEEIRALQFGLKIRF